VYRVSTVLGLAEAVAAGIGCGCLPCFIGDANADIVRIGGTVPELHNELWILTHPDLRRAARVRVFMECVGTKLARYRKLLEGENGTGKA
jgi:DNA-binding transcriptional LysR family regulator